MQSFRICMPLRVLAITFALSVAPIASGQVGPPPVFPAIDANGVDTSIGAFTHAVTDVVIGDPGQGGLAFTRYYQSAPTNTWTHNHNGYITSSGGNCVVVIGAKAETFGGSCGSGTHNQQMGSQLTYNSSTATYVYVMRDGTTAAFQAPNGMQAISTMPSPFVGYLTSVTSPAGLTTTYSYEWSSPICYPSPEYCYFQQTFGRLWSVATNAGYMLSLEYVGAANQTKWANSVTGINKTIEYCTGSNCSGSWPSADFTFNSNTHYLTATNSLGHTTSYSYTGFGMSEIQSPHHANHDVNISYTSGRVSSVDLGFGAWTYSYSDAAGKRTTTVTNPDSSTKTYVSEIASGRVTSFTNELGNAITYEFDGAKRNTKVTRPLGNYTQYAYDARGNITEVRHVSETPNTPPDIVTKASFPASCTNVRTCNKPTWTEDAKGYRTEFTYNSTHGGVGSITLPAPSGAAPVGSGTRPQTRFSYAQFQARYKVPAGTFTNGTAVWRLTGTSSCASGSSPSCLGTADETVVSIAFPGAGTPNNIQPNSTTSSSGTGSISSTQTFSYTNWGDIQTIDGPLSGSADTTRLYYDAGRQLVGVVGPDPDGGGALLHRAVRTYFNTVGLPTSIERGTVTSQSDTAFSSFTLLETQDVVYDSYARPEISRLWDGASVVSLVQTNYDNRGRPLCSTLRMNPANFSSLPDACSLGTAGSFGADRITRTVHDATGRVSSVQSAYGTSTQQTTVAYTYTANGQAETLTDARGFTTGYTYDGHGRVVRFSYPDPSYTGLWSATDYELIEFDNYGRVEQERRRNGAVFNFAYDNLDRVTMRDAPGSQPDLGLDYDLLGRVTSRTLAGGHVLTTTYDALSRIGESASSILGDVEYEYDAAGRRVRMIYPDGFYATYAHDIVGQLTGIYENGTTTLATYSYDNLGRRTSLTRGNGVTTTYAYGAVSRLQSLTHDAAGSSHDVSFSLSYNPAGQIAERSRNNAIYDWTLPASYSSSYAADGLNRYTTALGVTPTYDSLGNLTSDGSRTYGYDHDSRLTSASGGVTQNYDPAGRLHQVSGSAATRFLYDGVDIIGEFNGSGALQRRYVHGPGMDEPLLWYEGSGTSDRRWLITDERGSVIAVSNASGAVTHVNKYDLYGIPAASNQGLFQYTGQAWIPDLSLYHYKARTYHPRFGRFMQTDPIGYGGGLNLYAYVGNDPVDFRDPLGLCPKIGAPVPEPGPDGETVLSECFIFGGSGGGSGGGGMSPTQPNYPDQSRVAATFMSRCGVDPSSPESYQGDCRPQESGPRLILRGPVSLEVELNDESAQIADWEPVANFGRGAVVSGAAIGMTAGAVHAMRALATGHAVTAGGLIGVAAAASDIGGFAMVGAKLGAAGGFALTGAFSAGYLIGTGIYHGFTALYY